MTIDSKPMCEWMRMVAHRIASIVGFSDPAANGAIVRGMRPAEIKRSNVQWYEPWLGLAVGTGAGSFATRRLADVIKLMAFVGYRFLEFVLHRMLAIRINWAVRWTYVVKLEELLVCHLHGKQLSASNLEQHPEQMHFEWPYSTRLR